MPRIAALAMVFIAALFWTGCGTLGRNVGATPGVPPLQSGDPGYDTDLQVQFLSVAGFVFRRGNDVIMTGPFYSHHNLFKVVTGWPIGPDNDLIDRQASAVPNLDSIPVMLIGHAHYDHLMDVPRVLTRHMAPNARVFGSNTASNILRAVIAPNQLLGVDTFAGDFHQRGATGTWISINPTLRIMALRSEHSHHFGPIKMFQGPVNTPLSKLPRTAYGWKEGQTLAYVIDFLDRPGGRIAYRIVYHDSAVNFPDFGGLPLNDGRDPDLFVVCLGAARNCRSYPEGVIAQLRPRHVIVGHWEDFFSKRPDRPEDTRVVILGQPKKFLNRAKNAMTTGTPILPLPGAWMRFPPPP